MKLTKKHLCRLPSCYAVSALPVVGRLRYLFAADDAGACLSIDAETLATDYIWDSPGGTMSIVPLPGFDGEFLASRRFLPGFESLHAEIVRVCWRNNRWEIAPWLKLPYVHRFDILERGGVRYFLGCILSSTSGEHADWSCPGYLVAGELNDRFEAPMELIRIAEGMTHNHGYCRVEKDGFSSALTTCDEGIFEVVPPAQRDGEWIVRKLLDVPASDVAIVDLDGDGTDELAVIEPFHGNAFVVYKPIGGVYREVYRYPYAMDFVHAIWGGKLKGKPVFLCGCRAIHKELFYLEWSDGAIREHVIELGYGPSNVHVIHADTEPEILVANRESGECAVFLVDVDADARE